MTHWYICAGWGCGFTRTTLAAVLAHQRKVKHGSGRYYLIARGRDRAPGQEV